MFNEKNYEVRLAIWSDFRKIIETIENPVSEIVNFYQTAPWISLQVDPWNIDSWPTAWELILDNKYCSFSILLGIFYTLKYTDRFTNSTFFIFISQKENKYPTYILQVDDIFIVISETISVESQIDAYHILKKYNHQEIN